MHIASREELQYTHVIYRATIFATAMARSLFLVYYVFC